MKTEEVTKIQFFLKAYTKKELSLLYGVSPTTLRRWLKNIPETANTGKKNWLDVNQVKAILKVHGVPGVREFE